MASKGCWCISVWQDLVLISPTRLLFIDNSAVVTVEGGILRAASEGLAKVRVEVGAQVLNVDVAVVPAAKDVG